MTSNLIANNLRSFASTRNNFSGGVSCINGPHEGGKTKSIMKYRSEVGVIATLQKSV